MAMLAEPRQRKRYNLVPRGKPLYEDENRFGTKMLEKMGWKKGTGLGAKENGSKDFVRIRYKNDSLGLGFEDRDDQWTEHEQCFNGLLKTLNNEEENNETTIKQENGDESEDDIPRVGFGFSQTSVNEEKKPKVEKLKEKISGISLEERSKQSRARVHYKKFTKGKDLAQYSEKDLANIFGKKAADEQQTANDFYQQLNNTFQKKSQQIKGNDEEEPIKGVQMINTGISVNDYFKTKMEDLKNGKNGLENTENGLDNDIDSNNQLEKVTKKKKKKKNEKKDQDEVEEEVNTQTEKKDNGQIIYSSVSVTDYFKMKMEALKNRKNGLNNSENKEDNKNTCEEVIPDEEVSNKKKKKKKDKDQNINDDNINPTESVEGNKKEKKSKKCFPLETEKVSIDDESKPKKKKDKTKKKTEEEIEQQNEEVELSKENSVTKKRKHDKTTDNILSSTPQDIIEIDLTEEPRKKKQKKNKTNEKGTEEIIEIDESDNKSPNITEDQTISKEKKKKKKSKINKESNDSTDKVENPSNTNQSEKVSDQPSEKPRKAKRKEVSSSAKYILFSGVSLQDLNLDELKKKYNAFNIYPISSFCAEKFRNINLNDFTGSTLPQIEGYSLGPNLQLDVQINKNDEERITNLWNCVLNKYSQLQKPKKTYQHYVREVIKARKTKQRKPKLYVKTWQRKNAFQVI